MLTKNNTNIASKVYRLIKRNKKDVDKLKSNLNKVEKKLRNYLDFSRSLQINNKELKTTVGR